MRHPLTCFILQSASGLLRFQHHLRTTPAPDLLFASEAGYISARSLIKSASRANLASVHGDGRLHYRAGLKEQRTPSHRYLSSNGWQDQPRIRSWPFCSSYSYTSNSTLRSSVCQNRTWAHHLLPRTLSLLSLQPSYTISLALILYQDLITLFTDDSGSALCAQLLQAAIEGQQDGLSTHRQLFAVYILYKKQLGSVFHSHTKNSRITFSNPQILPFFISKINGALLFSQWFAWSGLWQHTWSSTKV